MKNFKQENHMIKSVFHKGKTYNLENRIIMTSGELLSRKSCLWVHM